MQELVITAVGNDKPGLVEQISGFLLEQGANVADARMINLRGQFAMIILVEVSDQLAELIREKATRIGAAAGLNLNISHAGLPNAVRMTGMPFKLRTYAMDQPGIVHRVTGLLAKRGVNIEELQTRLAAASVSGTPLFSMELTLTLPSNLSVKALRAELQELCESLNCDMDLAPAD